MFLMFIGFIHNPPLHYCKTISRWPHQHICWLRLYVIILHLF